jgi:hypothetical protein
MRLIDTNKLGQTRAVSAIVRKNSSHFSIMRTGIGSILTKSINIIEIINTQLPPVDHQPNLMC